MTVVTDPVADWTSSGVVALTGRLDGPPLVPPGQAASRARELSARIFALTAGTGAPVRVDGAELLAERAAFTGHSRRGRTSVGGACRLLPTGDGWAAVSCARPDDPLLLGALVGTELTGDPWPAVTAWLRDHSGAELAERATLLGLAAGPVALGGGRVAQGVAGVGVRGAGVARGVAGAAAGGAGVASGVAGVAVGGAGVAPGLAGAAAGGAGVASGVAGAAVSGAGVAPGAAEAAVEGAGVAQGVTGAAVGGAEPASPLAAPTPRPVDGLLVVDFSALWAGPLCSQLLGLAGARVVKVETPTRPDGARNGHPGFYRLLHAGHRSVVLDPDTPSGRHALAALVAAADIVVEASRPRALARFGLDAHAAVAAGTTWISITAAGRASDRIGFGDDVAAGAGLVAREPDDTPLFCGDATADPLTGLTAAALALTAPADGTGVLHDIAMTEVVAATLDAPPHRPAPAARRTGTGWAVETAEGWRPVALPRRREPAGDAPRTGEHTTEVLRGLGIPTA